MSEREYRPKKRSSDFTDESTSSYAKHEPSKPLYDDDEYISDERLDEIMREENFMFAMAGVEPNEHRLGLSHEAELDRIFASGIPIAIVTTYGTSIGSKAIWQTLGQVIARHFGQKAAIALGLTVGDGPLPVADAFAMGLMVVAAWQIARQWDELWAEVEQELANSEIVVTQEPENQVYTTPNEEQRGIEHTGSVPPQIETATPGFDTEAGRDVDSQQHTGNTSGQEVNWDNYIFENRRRNVNSHDAEGGHTNDKHIGKSERWLRERINKEELDEASSFYDYAAANLTQARFVKKYKKDIDIWLRSNKKGTFVREVALDRNIGIYVPKKGKARHVKKAKVILGKNNSELGYRAVTSFPIP